MAEFTLTSARTLLSALQQQSLHLFSAKAAHQLNPAQPAYPA